MYQALVEQIPAVLYINGPGADAQTWYVSPQTDDILGLPAQGWFDNTWSTRLHPADYRQTLDNYQDFLRSADVGVDEYRFIRPDGRQIWIHDRVTIIRDEQGAPILVQGVMLDITERRRAQEVLARIEEIGRRFTDLLLAGSTLRDILQTLSDIVQCPVAFEDPAHQLVEYADAAGSAPTVLNSWPAHSRSHASAGSRDECHGQVVRLRDAEWGRLHVLTTTRPVDEVDRLAVDRAAAAIGLWLLTNREIGSLADHARAQALADIWQGRGGSGREALARFSSLGVDLDRPVLVGFAVELGQPADRSALSALAQTRRRAMDRVLAAVRAILADRGLPAVSAIVGELCLGLVALTPAQDPREVVGAVAARLVERIGDREAGLVVSVGISAANSPDTLRRALSEATEAAAHGAGVSGRGGVHHVSDLGLRSLLARLGAGPELSHFVEGELGPLLAHDATSRRPLIATLAAYLAHGGGKAETARELHVQRRTLYYRLARIEGVLGRRLDDPTTRLRLQVALHGLDVLRSRDPVIPE